MNTSPSTSYHCYNHRTVNLASSIYFYPNQLSAHYLQQYFFSKLHSRTCSLLFMAQLMFEWENFKLHCGVLALNLNHHLTSTSRKMWKLLLTPRFGQILNSIFQEIRQNWLKFYRVKIIWLREGKHLKVLQTYKSHLTL